MHIDGQRYRVRPHELSGEQREAALEQFYRSYPSLRQYQRYTSRQFPLIALDDASTLPTTRQR